MDLDVLALPRPRRRRVVVSSLPSDSHTWGLVFLQLLLEELDCEVTNLGACVPAELLLERCAADPPDLVVLSSVNGHGYLDGLRVIERLREHPELGTLPVVIGGKLGIAGGELGRTDALLAAGFDAVFDDDGAALPSFMSFVKALSPAAAA
jgi:methylaspartate mutase sigma subunit